jgi:cytoskeletal protein CcmA (bactofilin family)
MSAGAVTVERTGELKVASEVEILRVFGKVSSPVKATTMVEVFAGGDVQDSLDTPSLQVAPGGRISGGHLVIGQR